MLTNAGICCALVLEEKNKTQIKKDIRDLKDKRDTRLVFRKWENFIL